jgi:hypothetical protein
VLCDQRNSSSVPDRANICLLQNNQTPTGAHAASYSVSTQGSFAEDKTSHQRPLSQLRAHGVIPLLPHTSSARSGCLSTAHPLLPLPAVCGPQMVTSQTPNRGGGDHVVLRLTPAGPVSPVVRPHEKPGSISRSFTAWGMENSVPRCGRLPRCFFCPSS